MAVNNSKEIPRVVVGILIVNDEDKIFLTRSHKWNGRWVVPGGHLEWGETLHDCARREVSEETGLTISDIQLLSVQESIFSEEFFEKRHMVFMDYRARTSDTKVTLNDEHQEYRWFTPEEALSLSLNTGTKKFIENFIALNSNC